jgi:hypothetical protein
MKKTTAAVIITQKNLPNQNFGQSRQNLEIRRESGIVTPDHPDVVPWEVRQKHWKSLSPSEKAKYAEESQELWEKFSEASPRMIKTFRGDVVHYDQTK